MSSEGSMPNLSRDIIADILAWLPVKSVCRFRCVSKSWLYLTTGPHFSKNHVNRSLKQKKVILTSKSSIFSLDPEAPIDDDMLPVELDFPLKNHPDTKRVHMFGSCNGLVCIRPQAEVFFIFNPFTGESLRIPDCPMPSHACPPEPYRLTYHHSYGFGCAPSTDDYKFVKIAYGCMVFIFSLKSNSWNRAQDFPRKHCLEGSGTFLKGAIHWLCGRVEVGGTCFIAAFDLAEEKFSELPPPDAVKDYHDFTTGVLGGCLCLLHQHEKLNSFWIMNKYGVKESWSLISIAKSYSSLSLKPLCYWKDNRILMVRSSKQLLLCKPDNGTCKNFLANGLPDEFCADVYVESFVSPNYYKNSGLSLAPIAVYTLLLLLPMKYLLLVTEVGNLLAKKNN